MTVSRRQLMAGGVVAGAALVIPGLLSSVAHADTGMAVSVGRAGITPLIGECLAGYAVPAPRRAARINRELFARCTILWDHGVPHVIVTAETLAFPRSVNTEIRRRVTALGVAGADFVLTATHTHNGGAVRGTLDPYMAYGATDADIDRIGRYTDRLIGRIAALVEATLGATRTPCTLDYQVLDENFAHNREHLADQERDVPTLVARGLDGSPVAVLFGYGCDPVSYGRDPDVDPDYPGTAISVIEDRTGAFAQFILGPAGDQDPNPDFGGYATIGLDLGLTVVGGIVAQGRPVTGPIDTVYDDLSLPLDITDTPESRAETAALLAARRSDPGLAPWVHRHAERMIQQIRDHSFATSVPLPIQRWRFQGSPALQLAFTGGELVSGYAVHFRQRYGRSDALWITGYANEIPACLPSDEMLYPDCPPTYASGEHYGGGWFPGTPGLGGGSMCLYGYLGHFRSRPRGTTGIGVEQILTDALAGVL